MKITPELFDAHLTCPTKCWLRATSESPSGNEYAEWVKSQTEACRAAETERLLAETPAGESARSPSVEHLKAAKWRLATDVVLKAEFQPPSRSSRREEAHSEVRGEKSEERADQSLVTSAATAQGGGVQPELVTETRLHTLERVPSEGRGKAAQFIPIRFIWRNKLTKDDKLLLAFDAFVLSSVLGREITTGKIIHWDDHATLKVKTSALAGEVRKRVEKITALLANPAPPNLVLNRHCAECEFRDRCRKLAIEKDDLSLLWTFWISSVRARRTFTPLRKAGAGAGGGCSPANRQPRQSIRRRPNPRSSRCVWIPPRGSRRAWPGLAAGNPEP